MVRYHFRNTSLVISVVLVAAAGAPPAGAQGLCRRPDVQVDPEQVARVVLGLQ